MAIRNNYRVEAAHWKSFCDAVQTAEVNLSRPEKALRITEITPDQYTKINDFIQTYFHRIKMVHTEDYAKIKITADEKDRMYSLRNLVTVFNHAKWSDRSTIELESRDREYKSYLQISSGDKAEEKK